MTKVLIICVLVITAVGKGQQQTQKNQYQQQFNQLFTVSSKPQTHAQLQQQPIQEQKSIAPNDDEPTYRPIMFPSSEDDEKISDKFHAAPFAHNNLIPQTVEQKVEIPSPTVELLRPTRHNVATMSSRPSRPHTDMEVEYVRDFAWKLFQGSKLPSPIENLVLCPLQPQLQLSLLRHAAAGNTESEIGETIRETDSSITRDLLDRLKSTRSDSSDLGLASAIFTADNLKLNSSFLQEAQNRHIDILPVNFGSADESNYIVNNWVANATKNKIRSIYKPDINRGTRVLLANTIYFNGEWKFGFNEVKSEPFFTTDKLVKNVPMMKSVMSLRSEIITLRTGFTGQWIELPYRGDEFSMVVILPFQRHYLDEFIRSMRTSDFNDILKQLTSSYKKSVHLSMPKFSIESSFSVVNVLLKMGLVDLFTQASNLPYLAKNEPLRVDDILQQSILSVDEKGTIAAAATISHVVTLSLNSAPEEVFFNVNQPFLSVIVDKRNKVPLFISKVFDP